MVLILKPLMKIVLDLQAQYKQTLDPIVAKLSKGIASLPDELLRIVFKFAVWMEGGKGTRQAPSISRISRRLREVALEEHGLWTTLHSNAKKEELATFIFRSGTDTNLHAFVHIADLCRYGGQLHEFMDVCQPTTHRWETLTVTTSHGLLLDNNGRSNYWDAEYVLQAFHCKYGAQFPRLEELSVQCTDSDTFESRFALPWSWMSPNFNLRLLKCSNYLPSPFGGAFSSVTTLSLKQTMSRYYYVSGVKTLFEFLTSIPSVSNFELELEIRPGIDSEDDFQWLLDSPKSVIPSITSFHLRLVRLAIESNRQKLIAALLQALHMPNMVDLSILIELWDSHESEAECAELMRDLSCAVLPVGVADPHASLTSLHYKITYDAKDEFTLLRTRLGTFPRIFTIPLDKIPTVSTLTITARTRTLFTREAQAGVVGGSEKCGLQEVHFVGCDYMEIEDFRSSIQSLKDIEVWESIEQIVVEYCDSLEYDEALEVVGIQRLRMRDSTGARPSSSLLRPVSNPSAISTKRSQFIDSSASKHKISISEGDALVMIQENVEKRRLRLKPKPAIPARIVSSNRFSVLDDDDAR